MSQWTHIAGIVRLDSFGPMMGVSDAALELHVAGLVGKGARYDEDGRARPYNATSDREAPGGSEGSIDFAVYVKPGNGAPKATLAFWGDLRDRGVEYVPTLMAWFRTLLEAWQAVPGAAAFRAAVLEIDIEGGPTMLCRATCDVVVGGQVSVEVSTFDVAALREPPK